MAFFKSNCTMFEMYLTFEEFSYQQSQSLQLCKYEFNKYKLSKLLYFRK